MDDSPELATAWSGFATAAAACAARPIAGLFDVEPDRLERLSFTAAGLELDLSKQPWDAPAHAACLELARAAAVEAARGWLFEGSVVNASEGRAVLHPALRAPRNSAFEAQRLPVSPEVDSVRDRMRDLADAVRSGLAHAAGGAPFRAILHIGIGGSDLGPRLVWEALRPLAPALDLRFAANVDPADLAQATAGLDPATTLVIVVSKTFTTQETLANAEAARAWLLTAVPEAQLGAHLAAVSAAPELAQAFGVDPARVFSFRDWVGGRFSIWSAVGLSCAIALGWEPFEAFLEGAAAMDAHFTGAPLARNAPIALALAQILNRNGLDRRARAVVPYAQRLRLLPAYLQQLEMESNGKRVGRDGRPVAHATAPVVFGDAGTNGQHAFFQMLHQGSDVVPLEFIAVRRAETDAPAMQRKLLANVVAQAEALMVGRDEAAVRAELEAQGLHAAEIDSLAPQRTFPGNRPSTMIVMDRLTPQTLGALLALYEHKTFVEGVIWGINSFDQWGVELGKTLAMRVLDDLERVEPGDHDPSTTALIARLKD